MDSKPISGDTPGEYARGWRDGQAAYSRPSTSPTATAEPLAEHMTLASALAKAAEWFREYEAIHTKKENRLRDDGHTLFADDARAKAKRNRERAEFCEAALRAALSVSTSAPKETSEPPCEGCGGTGKMPIRASAMPRGFMAFAGSGLRDEDGVMKIVCPLCRPATDDGEEIERLLLEHGPLDACITENGDIGVKWLGWWGTGDTITEAMERAYEKWEAHGRTAHPEYVVAVERSLATPEPAEPREQGYVCTRGHRATIALKSEERGRMECLSCGEPVQYGTLPAEPREETKP